MCFTILADVAITVATFFLSHSKRIFMIKRFLSKNEVVEVWIPVVICYGFIAMAILIAEYGRQR
jgi:hypothetical protein